MSSKRRVADILFVVGYLLIWAAAKVHTMRNLHSGHYIERHWPYWAAMVAWPVVCGVGYWLFRTFPGSADHS